MAAAAAAAAAVLLMVEVDMEVGDMGPEEADTEAEALAAGGEVPISLPCKLSIISPFPALLDS